MVSFGVKSSKGIRAAFSSMCVAAALVMGGMVKTADAGDNRDVFFGETHLHTVL